MFLFRIKSIEIHSHFVLKQVNTKVVVYFFDHSVNSIFQIRTTTTNTDVANITKTNISFWFAQCVYVNMWVGVSRVRLLSCKVWLVLLTSMLMILTWIDYGDFGQLFLIFVVESEFCFGKRPLDCVQFTPFNFFPDFVFVFVFVMKIFFRRDFF